MPVMVTLPDICHSEPFNITLSTNLLHKKNCHQVACFYHNNTIILWSCMRYLLALLQVDLRTMCVLYPITDIPSINSHLCLGLAVFFVQISDLLFLTIIQPALIAMADRVSFTLYQYIALCLLFNINVGLPDFYHQLVATNTSVGPSTGTPNICSLYLNTLTTSVAALRVMNYELKTEFSTVFCSFGYHAIGALFKQMMILLCDLRDSMLLA